MLYESQYYGIVDPDLPYIKHHGIKGQKWGVRRWQYENGSLTPDGYVHYGYGNGSKKNSSQEHKKEGLAEYLILRASLSLITVATLATSMAIINHIDKKNAKKAAENEEIMNKRISELPVDPKTGFHLKDREWTEDEDMKAVNPAFKNFDKDTKSNCMLCTSAYELRRRGYDVMANKSEEGYPTPAIKRWFPKAEVKNVGHVFETYADILKLDKDQQAKLYHDRLKASRGENYEMTKKVVNELLAQPTGARGNLMITFPGFQGHSVVYEVTENKNKKQVVIRDCQSGQKLTPSHYLNYSIGAEYARLDNVDFDPKEIKEVAT